MISRERIGNTMAAALNRVVEMDPDARRKLRRLEGRSVTIELAGPDIDFALTVEDGRFAFGPVEKFEPSARLRASPAAFAALAGSSGQAAGQIELSGDTDTARRFQQFFTELDPDFEEAATELFGDTIGVQVSRFVAGGLRWARHTSWRFAEDLSEYLREETRQLVTAPEMESFLDAVDDLRDDVERIEARIQRLERGR